MHPLTGILTILSLAQHLVVAHPTQFWESKQFKSLVSFENSYTDVSRRNYFASHDGSPPPVGWEQPDVCELPKTWIPLTHTRVMTQILAGVSGAIMYPRTRI